VRKATQRVCLYDDDEYPLEARIRNFKNSNASNCFIFSVFDTCRIAVNVNDDAKVRRDKIGYRSDSDDADSPRRYKNQIRPIEDNEGNFMIVYSSEPTKPTPSKGVTLALFNFLKEV